MASLGSCMRPKGDPRSPPSGCCEHFCCRRFTASVNGKVVVRKQGSHLPMSEKHGQEFARHLDTVLAQRQPTITILKHYCTKIFSRVRCPCCQEQRSNTG